MDEGRTLGGERGAGLLATSARIAASFTRAERGQVVVAYPFSGRPTPHRLELADGRQAYAMCAVDALGVAPMLASPVRVRSRDPVTGEQIVVDVSAEGDARWLPEETVVFVGGREGISRSPTSAARWANFFASPDTAIRYTETHTELTGRIVGVPLATAGGRAVFEEALR